MVVLILQVKGGVAVEGSEEEEAVMVCAACGHEIGFRRRARVRLRPGLLGEL
jgi:hypothetical protein